MPLHLIDLYNFKPPADLIVNREESQAIRINAAKTSLVSPSSSQPRVPQWARTHSSWRWPSRAQHNAALDRSSQYLQHRILSREAV